MALLCTQVLSTERPKMLKVVQIFEGEGEMGAMEESEEHEK